MKASAVEYRFRIAIQALIYLLGFLAPWLYLPGVSTSRSIDEPSWLGLSTFFYRQGWLSYNAAVMVFLILALIFTALGAWFHVWGAAYGSTNPSFHSGTGETLAADGPYRRTRNPLYLGTLLHTLGIALLMPPSGALFAVVLMGLFDFRFILAEESLFSSRFGPSYVAYKTAVPRFLPSLTPLLHAIRSKPQWLQGALRELYFILAFLVLAVFGWGFDKTLIRQGLLVSLGVWLVVQAFLPSQKVTITRPDQVPTP